ncbi:formate dehydrogenase [Bradyrhizobium genosp. P]|uniref:formate dehydrogenase n=1 Tax=Bradyrhizobium genosp. P TaxID=83641 RepID=UPI003CF882A2
MKGFLLSTVRRRDLLRATIAGTAAVGTEVLPFEAVAAEPSDTANKRKARYRASSAEVENFYRVNRYPAK